MGKLTDILKNGQAEELNSAWDTTEAADEFGPLPTAEYVARLVSGELFTSKTNATLGYKMAFNVLEGDHTGRQFWHDVWLTPAAMPMAKRDLSKLGITSLEQLEKPVPRGFRCRCKVTLRKSDTGDEYNAVRSFTVIGIDETERDAFAPDDDGSPAPAEGTGPSEGDDSEPEPAAATDSY